MEIWVGGRTATAYHEAGHAVVGQLMGGRVQWLEFGRGEGLVFCEPAVKDGDVDYFANAATKLAGPIAASMCPNGERLSDRDLRYVVRFERSCYLAGLGTTDWHLAQPPIVVLEAAGLAEGEYLWRAARRARALLRQHWSAVEAVRRASMKRRANGQLTGDEIRALIEDPSPAVAPTGSKRRTRWQTRRLSVRPTAAPCPAPTAGSAPSSSSPARACGSG